MDELCIDYNKKGFQKYFSFIFAGYSALLGLFLCVKELLDKNYSIIFFCSFILVILSVILILCFSVWLPKPLLKVNTEVISVNITGQTPVILYWKDIKAISIGISYLIIDSSTLKQTNIDLAMLKYEDLKHTKSRIVELCENKNIPFHNA